MKFKLSAKDFKNIIERIAVVAAKKSSLPILECVQIIANDGAVMFRTTDLEAYVTITANTEVIENGTAIVELNSIKKLYTVSGDVTFERDGVKFSASNGKKKNEIPCYPESQNELMPEFPNNPPRESAIMTVPDKADFIKVLENLAPCLSVIPSRPINTGYNLNSGKYGIIAIDGYHALSFLNPWCEQGRTLLQFCKSFMLIPKPAQILITLSTAAPPDENTNSNHDNGSSVIKSSSITKMTSI